ncbi:hypothetical protein HanXRQr2_Chr15g0689571 [Helianthus annuus]|uniref:Uncharacterized protein n=1 Tax=Helianthus annuus TaxID=4232 RepID=A0A9K3DZM9_HELAN|nr:hypothetical protein HanXRQr2_Chr15g0689571 [Helianthus annuus]KAJ0830955.1 hypothetical protein HanPSC8_Chr15g0661421 [Helianthus annuus]
MEGAYNHALNARQMVPHKTNVYIMDLLARTLKMKLFGVVRRLIALYGLKMLDKCYWSLQTTKTFLNTSNRYKFKPRIYYL